jgi:hypothetical protein
MTALQLQWSLNQTADSSITFARGIIRAATHDNVQPLALAACERFGTTTAMCDESSRKIEDVIRKVTAPSVIKFLKAQVGYSPDDSAAHLSRSQAGVRFLALVAPFISTMSLFDAALALEAMLRRSAVDTTLLPTARHLQDLLAALECRLVRSGFTDSVLGWELLLPRIPNIPESLYNFFENRHSSYPDKNGIERLVNAFRELDRIGDATSVVLKTTTCTGWVIAFTKWCLGVPPSIVLEDGTPLLEQNSRVTVIPRVQRACVTECPPFELIVNHSLQSPAELIVATTDIAWTGLVTVENYGRSLLREYEFETGTGFAAIVEALPFALKQVVEEIRLAPFREVNPGPFVWLSQENPEGKGKPIHESLMAFTTKPFPIDPTIRHAARLLLGFDLSDLSSVTDIQLVWKLPTIRAHSQHLEAYCPCPACNNHNKYLPCGLAAFTAKLSRVVAEVLCLSLFDCPENLLVQHRPCIPEAFNNVVQSILTTGRPVNCKLFDIIEHALNMVGHPTQGCEKTIMSSHKGQVVYPKLYETLELAQPGFLSLCWIPGILKFEGEIYSHATGSGFQVIHQPSRSSVPINVDKPLNLMPHVDSIWHVSRGNGYLKVEFGIRRQLVIPPQYLLEGLASSLLLSTCSHEPDAGLRTVDDRCRYTLPLIWVRKIRGSGWDGLTNVMAVDGNNGFRLLTLGISAEILSMYAKIPYVLRGNGCLQCAIDIARRANVPVVIC